MIRNQQLQLQQIQQQQSSASGTPVVEDWMPTFERSMPIPFSLAHSSVSRPSMTDLSHTNHGLEWSALAGGEIGPRRNSRDENAFIQAEAAMLSRENQMLRMRIRELGRCLVRRKS
jgi:hypothetical protein